MNEKKCNDVKTKKKKKWVISPFALSHFSGFSFGARFCSEDLGLLTHLVDREIGEEHEMEV